MLIDEACNNDPYGRKIGKAGFSQPMVRVRMLRSARGNRFLRRELTARFPQDTDQSIDIGTLLTSRWTLLRLSTITRQQHFPELSVCGSTR